MTLEGKVAVVTGAAQGNGRAIAINTCDRIDPDGFVHLPELPGKGYEIQWDYIDDNLVDPMVEMRRHW